MDVFGGAAWALESLFRFAHAKAVWALSISRVLVDFEGPYQNEVVKQLVDPEPNQKKKNDPIAYIYDSTGKL